MVWLEMVDGSSLARLVERATVAPEESLVSLAGQPVKLGLSVRPPHQKIRLWIGLPWLKRATAGRFVDSL